MSTSVKSIAVVTTRTLLGLLYVVFGLNFFFHFIPSPPPDPTSPAGIFLGGLFSSGYFFPFLKTLEVILGALLIARLFVPLSLIVLMPISLNIFLFHALLAPDTVALSIVILALHIYLAYAYRSYFAPLFIPKALPA